MTWTGFMTCPQHRLLGVKTTTEPPKKNAESQSPPTKVNQKSQLLLSAQFSNHLAIRDEPLSVVAGNSTEVVDEQQPIALVRNARGCCGRTGI